jgi:TIR domain
MSTAEFKAEVKRDRIFLSHATPEDNEFTRWLAAKLTIAGYNVWYDFGGGLKFGDNSWDTIETTLRNDTFRLVAIASPISCKKDGVKKEWALAATLEKQIPRFIIPVRIGNLNYSDLPILIHQKNLINFEAGWHLGLQQLLETLETDHAPKVAAIETVGSLMVLQQCQPQGITFIEKSETLDSNWLELISLPDAIESTKILSSQREIPLSNKNSALPWFEFGDHIVGFANRFDIQKMFEGQVPMRPAEAYLTDEFLAGKVEVIAQVEKHDAQNRITYLVRQAWDLYAESKGLHSCSMANRSIAWYVPLGLLPKEKAEFVDFNGKTRKRQLAGISDKNKVNWHYAVSAVPILDFPKRLELRSHIVFSDFEGNLVDVTRMHRLRRGFCRNWWNDRWRGFMRGFLAYLAGGENEISMPVGSNKFIKYAAFPMTFNSPIGLSDHINLEEEAEIELGDLVTDPTEFDDIEEGASE